MYSLTAAAAGFYGDAGNAPDGGPAVDHGPRVPRLRRADVVAGAVRRLQVGLRVGLHGPNGRPVSADPQRGAAGAAEPIAPARRRPIVDHHPIGRARPFRAKQMQAQPSDGERR